jgi:hypothetical protein
MKKSDVPMAIVFSFFLGEFIWLFFITLAKITIPAVEIVGAIGAIWLWQIIGIGVRYYSTERNLEVFQTQALAVIKPFEVLWGLFSRQPPKSPP